MRIKYIFIAILSIFLLFSCFKKDSLNNFDQASFSSIIEEDKEKEINLDKLREIIDKSDKIDIEVFFAISILHKSFIDQFIDKVSNRSEEEQKIFFKEKNKEFFRILKYTEEEYREFQLKNEKSLIDYLNSHPELMNYLITIN